MVYGFALDPELVATWGNKADYRYFYDKFGIGQPRMMVEFPKLKNWRGQVLKAANNLGDLEKQRVTEMISILTERVIPRLPHREYDGTRPWLENAEDEHAGNPFHAILAHNNPRRVKAVLIGENLGGDREPRWELERSGVVNRKASAMAASIQALLRNCREIIFVDPHFGPENARHRRPLEAFLAVLVKNHDVTITVLTSTKPSIEFFKSECEKSLPKIIPRGLSVCFSQLSEKPGGEKLHNRYVLTDIGGVKFNIGLDDGDDGQTDDVDLMDRRQYELRWSQYAGGAPAFVCGEPVTVTGRKPE